MSSASLLPDALLDPAAWPEAVERPQLVRTHSGWVFLGQELAYKLKQPVRFAFLDFSTLERREAALREELRLNEALGAGIYRRLVPITTRGDGGLAIDGSGEFVEWALEMRRLPRAEMASERLRAGTLRAGHLRALATLVARFHEAPLDPELARRHASPEALAALFVGNANELVEEFEMSGDDDAADVARAYAADIGATVTHQAALVQRRLDAGRVRDGHGDMHLGNICLEDDRPLVYDRLEFEPAFRIQDVAADVAFPVMDLRVRGRPDLAEAFLDTYIEVSGDAELREVLEMHVAHRAAVRAKVEAIRHRLGQDRDASMSSRRYLLRAHAGVRGRPLALVLGGLSGTGKSHLAGALQRDTDWEWLRTDLERKQLFGLAPTERLDAAGQAELYAPGVSKRVYAAVIERAKRAWADGRSVILDGTYLRRARRDELRAAAREAGVDAALVWLECPDAVIRKRLAERRRRDDDPSDADVAVYERQLGSQEPPTPDEGATHVDSRRNESSKALAAAAAGARRA